MPAGAYDTGTKFLTQPKPDLAICFVREAVTRNYLWNSIPEATQQLTCFEKLSETGIKRFFRFCTIEPKKPILSPDNVVARNQSLNNASRVLQNMYLHEIFRDAGEDHKEKFFAQVRFFSAVY